MTGCRVGRHSTTEPPRCPHNPKFQDLLQSCSSFMQGA
ncbi:unnamed protein product [Nyctereutes procyonoides]|uniref:(raccoon dog) hypothetical protein n=1 Tax=Nyctereutes procyonoides TaxID=34880 RepID=A0A811Y0E4_NYCPR|nr:unnamed protein product [Nyctereutes procyonoides]